MGVFIALLVLGMLTTGCLNTLLLKYQDQTCDTLLDADGAGCASFPVLQSLMMFVGESLCFLAIGAMKLAKYWKHYKITKRGPLFVDEGEYAAVATDEVEEEEEVLMQSLVVKPEQGVELTGWATLYLALPSICDILGTTIGSVGLLLVPASVYQMCRGSLVLYVAILSVVFLGRRLVKYQWLCLMLVMLGVFVIGLSNVIYTDTNTPGKQAESVQSQAEVAKNAALGILFITGAQLFTASQFVLEEWVLSKYSVEPLRVAGLEGIFGSVISTVGIVVAYQIYGRTNAGHDGTFDVISGLETVLAHTPLWSAFLLFAISIASFNFFGLSVTRSVSATSRSTIDTCRTLFIWAISMLLGWEHFKLLQLCGFIILVYATLVFNGVMKPPRFLAEPAEIEVRTGQEHTLE